VVADVAVLYDYDNLWSLNFQPGYAGNSLQAAIARYYNALWRAGVNVDIVNRRADLSQYKLVLAPDLSIMPDETARSLSQYVEKGGVLLADCRTGVKDANNLCHERTLPGLLAPVLGIRIEEYSALGADTAYLLSGPLVPDGTCTAIQYVDWVIPEGAQTLAAYGDQPPMKPFSAVTRHNHGRGKAWYVGTVMKEESFYDRLLGRLLRDAGIRPVVEPPAGIEVSVRRGGGRKLLFVINHAQEPKTIVVPEGKEELLRGTRTKKNLTLDGFGVAVILLEE
jgi:beta-galactosidase